MVAVLGKAIVPFNVVLLQFLALSDANALNFTWPVFALLVAFGVLGERMRRVELFGIAGESCSSVASSARASEMCVDGGLAPR